MGPAAGRTASPSRNWNGAVPGSTHAVAAVAQSAAARAERERMTGGKGRGGDFGCRRGGKLHKLPCLSLRLSHVRAELCHRHVRGCVRRAPDQ